MWVTSQVEFKLVVSRSFLALRMKQCCTARHNMGLFSAKCPVPRLYPVDKVYPRVVFLGRVMALWWNDPVLHGFRIFISRDYSTG
jgi:hypothetical protein